MSAGFAPCLIGLNFTGNPIEYPPESVLKKGTQAVLRYLRNTLRTQMNMSSTYCMHLIHSICFHPIIFPSHYYKCCLCIILPVNNSTSNA